MIFTIYKATNIKNGKIYIGFDSNWPNRMTIHKSAYKAGDTKFYRALRKYGWNSFEWQPIYQSFDKTHTLNIMENFFIDEYNSFNNGYNSTLGGDGTFGYIHTKQTKQKISMTHKGKKLTPEHIKILSEKGKNNVGEKNPQYGKPLSEETKLKISFSTKGIPKSMTEQHKKT
jgi:group I intron endonuclease